MLDRTETAQIPEVVEIDVPVVDLVTALTQEIADHVLARSLRTAGGRNRYKIPGRRKLRVEIGVDCIENSSPGIAGVHGITFPVVAFRIAAASIHCELGFRPVETEMPGNRNILFLIIGALIVAVGVLGYNLYQTRKEPEGLQINVGPSGLKIQNK